MSKKSKHHNERRRAQQQANLWEGYSPKDFWTVLREAISQIPEKSSVAKIILGDNPRQWKEVAGWNIRRILSDLSPALHELAGLLSGKMAPDAEVPTEKILRVCTNLATINEFLRAAEKVFSLAEREKTRTQEVYLAFFAAHDAWAFYLKDNVPVPATQAAE